MSGADASAEAAPLRQLFLQLHRDVLGGACDPLRILCALRRSILPAARQFILQNLMHAGGCGKESVQQAALLDFGIMIEALCTLLDTPPDAASRVGLALACLGLLLHEQAPCQLESTQTAHLMGASTESSVLARPDSRRGRVRALALWEIIVTLASKCCVQAVSYGCARLIHSIRSLSVSAGDFEFVCALDRACREPCGDPEARLLFLHNVRVVAAAAPGEEDTGISELEPLFSDTENSFEWRHGIGCGWWPADQGDRSSRNAAGYVVTLALNVLTAESASPAGPGSRRFSSAIRIAAAGLFRSVVQIVSSTFDAADERSGRLLDGPRRSVIDVFLGGLASGRPAGSATCSWPGWTALSDVTCETFSSSPLISNVLFDVWHCTLECCRQLLRKNPPSTETPRGLADYSALGAQVLTESLRWIESPRTTTLWRSYFIDNMTTVATNGPPLEEKPVRQNAGTRLSLSKGCQCLFLTVSLAQELDVLAPQDQTGRSTASSGQSSRTCALHVQARLATLIIRVFESCMPRQAKQSGGGGATANSTRQGIKPNTEGPMASSILNALLAEDDAGLFVFLDSALSLFARCANLKLTPHVFGSLSQVQRAAVHHMRRMLHPSRLFAELLTLLDFDASVVRSTCFHFSWLLFRHCANFTSSRKY